MVIIYLDHREEGGRGDWRIDRRNFCKNAPFHGFCPPQGPPRAPSVPYTFVLGLCIQSHTTWHKVLRGCLQWMLLILTRPFCSSPTTAIHICYLISVFMFLSSPPQCGVRRTLLLLFVCLSVCLCVCVCLCLSVFEALKTFRSSSLLL